MPSWEDAKALFDKAGHQLFRSCSHDFYAVRQESFWDIIIVNGDHRFAGVLWDLQHWFKRLKPGGLFLTDDYGNSDTPEVTPAVNKFIQLNQENISNSGYRMVPFQNKGKEVPISLTIVYFFEIEESKRNNFMAVSIFGPSTKPILKEEFCIPSRYPVEPPH